MSITAPQISIETGSEAHIQGDMAKAFVVANLCYDARVIWTT